MTVRESNALSATLLPKRYRAVSEWPPGSAQRDLTQLDERQMDGHPAYVRRAVRRVLKISIASKSFA